MRLSSRPGSEKLTRGEDAITVVYADETVTIKDYGSARQITLFERGEPVLQELFARGVSWRFVVVAQD